MWSRFVRALAIRLNLYGFLAKPVKYVLGTLMILVAPYLIYIFWGGVVILALIVLGIYLLYKLATKDSTA